MRYYTALTIAGSDSCGGAGIQADIKTMSALGVYAASAITAITVQNTKGVYGIQNVEPEIVKGQIEAVMEDIHPDAIKIGMVNDCDTIRAIAETLKKYQESFQHLVIDPVMVSTSGCRLMQEDALDVFITELLPLATLLTPNIPEAEILANKKIENVEDIKAAAAAISKLGCRYVLIKGGHFEGEEKIDYLFESGKQKTSYRGISVNTRNTHGTGCTLSSAITSYLAREMDMNTAIAMAKTYLSGAILAGKDIKIGEGHGPVNHFYEPKSLFTKS
ncbi:bifunctional hydroxymethylpyrimidine kinase/phosphomethylpyrimidine kinase [Segatella copri]|jgi:phosphomethylpyrimidine kinase|uniref:bifunctional hydroxymethylpyrimidine kinase/phosphomethylpyrimidine kinase n=1 Tax=Segatella copri TaxID=165179 RepID=UPI0025E6B091|nr:bifunctional hydroxymethylpyrimidine kinase/phosphomethylpyrimidine kinase [Segatella copri]